MVDELYVLGSVVINGAELEGVDTWSLDFGLEPDVLWGSGHVYPTQTGVLTRRPVFRATTFDVAKFNTWSETGLAQDATDSVISLQDQTAGGGRGSTPITLTIDAGRMHFESITAAQGQRASGSVTITPVSDGVAAIIAVGGIS